MNTCHTCHWTDCPDIGKEQQACENWTSDPDGEVENVADPFAAIEARFLAVDEELLNLSTRLDELARQFHDVIAAIVSTSQRDVD